MKLPNITHPSKMNMSILKNITKAVILSIVISNVILAPIAQAITSDDTRSILRETTFYDPNACSTAGSIGLGTTTGSDGPMYQSGLQGPYILEQFAIHVLKALALKTNTPESDVLTQEHVLAIVAFAYGEGGDIYNQWQFNPLNTGLNAPELIEGPAKGNGTQSFKSFDAGVEAAARHMLKPTQNRTAGILTKPDSTALGFMEVLTYYQRYPGNHSWAEASEPPNQENYMQERRELVQTVRADYNNIASLTIGTPNYKDQVKNSRIPSKLVYNFGNSGTGKDTNGANDFVSTDGCTGGQAANGAVAGNIVQTALNLAWPEGGHGPNKSDATAAYQATMPKYNGMGSYNDCGVFVATVMIASGVDPNYYKVGTGNQITYVQSHPEKYQIITGISDTSKLQPGDILLVDGHTFIYTGPIANGYDAVSASLGGHVPEAVHAIGSINYADRAGRYMAVRVIK